MRTATIIADASWCPETKMAGWGAWIASDRGKTGAQGAFSCAVESSEIAEMMAIVNALVKAIAANLVCEYDRVLIQTDCLGAIRQLDKQLESEFEMCQLNAVILSFHNVLREKQIQIEFRHVKGHSSNEGSRYTAQAKCDEKARTQMRKARNMYIEEQHAKEFVKKNMRTSGFSNEEVRRALAGMGGTSAEDARKAMVEMAKAFSMPYEVKFPDFLPETEPCYPKDRPLSLRELLLEKLKIVAVKDQPDEVKEFFSKRSKDFLAEKALKDATSLLIENKCAKEKDRKF